MYKNVLSTTITSVILLIFLTACSEDGQGNTTSKATDTNKAVATVKQPAANKTAQSRPNRPNHQQPKAAEPLPLEGFQSAAVMSKPVDFSSPEGITSSMQAIQEDAGEEASSRVESAINYMLFYDLSVASNKQKLYEKLNGKTPNQILAMTNR